MSDFQGPLHWRDPASWRLPPLVRHTNPYHWLFLLPPASRPPQQVLLTYTYYSKIRSPPEFNTQQEILLIATNLMHTPHTLTADTTNTTIVMTRYQGFNFDMISIQNFTKYHNIDIFYNNKYENLMQSLTETRCGHWAQQYALHRD